GGITTAGTMLAQGHFDWDLLAKGVTSSALGADGQHLTTTLPRGGDGPTAPPTGPSTASPDTPPGGSAPGPDPGPSGAAGPGPSSAADPGGPGANRTVSEGADPSAVSEGDSPSAPSALEVTPLASRSQSKWPWASMVPAVVMPP
ncbi:hypothetical protein, partial [Nonomuraea sp. MG754425]|uniref:hypothetical protein n=1 Tax=Nonomuraea sp. MG754425 TaxID=2570319 RepID=UPI001F23BB2F